MRKWIKLKCKMDYIPLSRPNSRYGRHCSNTLIISNYGQDAVEKYCSLWKQTINWRGVWTRCWMINDVYYTRAPAPAHFTHVLSEGSCVRLIKNNQRSNLPELKLNSTCRTPTVIEHLKHLVTIMKTKCDFYHFKMYWITTCVIFNT